MLNRTPAARQFHPLESPIASTWAWACGPVSAAGRGLAGSAGGVGGGRVGGAGAVVVVVSTGGGAVMVVVSTAAEAIEAYRELLSDPGAAVDLGRRARERAVEEHTYVHRARRLLELVGIDVPDAVKVANG